MSTARKLAAGNWKMNGFAADLSGLKELSARFPDAACDILICPPATLITRMVDAAAGAIAVGGQDCHVAQTGAHTGDVSADMLAEAGARYVIVGHSERRTDYGESDELVQAKANAGLKSGLIAIVCVGETQEDREAGRTLDVIGAQIAGSVPDDARGDTLVVAYEPVWAIGTGKVPTLEQIGEVHDFIRASLAKRFGAEIGNNISLLYGGSVKPANADEIFGVANVDGALVGGASLKAADFGGIIEALERSAG